MNNVSASLPQQINEAHRLAQEHAGAAIEHARKAGELLLHAKESAAHGAWLIWLSANVPGISARTAQGYMRLARHCLADPTKAQRVAHLSLRAALAALSEPKRSSSSIEDEVRSVRDLAPIEAEEILATRLGVIPPELRIAVEPGCITSALIDGEPAIMLAESQRNRGFWYVVDLRDRTYNSRPILGCVVGLLVGQIAGWDRAEWFISDQQDWFPEAA
jgi:hypothetical protein